MFQGVYPVINNLPQNRPLKAKNAFRFPLQAGKQSRRIFHGASAHPRPPLPSEHQDLHIIQYNPSDSHTATAALD